MGFVKVEVTNKTRGLINRAGHGFPGTGRNGKEITRTVSVDPYKLRQITACSHLESKILEDTDDVASADPFNITQTGGAADNDEPLSSFVAPPRSTENDPSTLTGKIAEVLRPNRAQQVDNHWPDPDKDEGSEADDFEDVDATETARVRAEEKGVDLRALYEEKGERVTADDVNAAAKDKEEGA